MESLWEYFWKEAGRRITLDSMKLYLSSKPELSNISTSTIRLLVKKILKKSCKVVSRIRPTSISAEGIRKFVESAWLIKTLILEEYDLVFIDEFTVDNRHTKLKSWTDRGKYGFINISNENFSKSFAIAFSKDRFYAVQDTLGAFDSIDFIEFIKKVKNAYDEERHNSKCKLVLVIDNAPIHVSRLVKEFWDANQIFVVTIWPYAPSLNPWEKVIAAKRRK